MAHTKESIQALLERNPAAVERALVVLFGHQTADEKVEYAAKYDNAVGFDAFRAPTCTKYARWVEYGLAQGKPYGRCIMAPAHKAKALKFIKRYWRQLIAAAEKRAAEEREYARLERLGIQNS